MPEPLLGHFPRCIGGHPNIATPDFFPEPEIIKKQRIKEIGQEIATPDFFPEHDFLQEITETLKMAARERVHDGDHE